MEPGSGGIPLKLDCYYKHYARNTIIARIFLKQKDSAITFCLAPLPPPLIINKK